jgi:hypothetical protein
MIDVARQFRDVVLESGYALTEYREDPSGHESVHVHRTLPVGLAALLGRTLNPEVASARSTP